MPGRTLLQQALPITFGLKAARWLSVAVRQIRALRGERAGLAVQFGGAAGTLAALEDRGLEVAARPFGTGSMMTSIGRARSAVSWRIAVTSTVVSVAPFLSRRSVPGRGKG